MARRPVVAALLACIAGGERAARAGNPETALPPPPAPTPHDPAQARNRLGDEPSPYLRQHADNPIHWWPWCPEALERAKAEDKPIFLSIGYSSCHWCHVMEHESFEDEEVAAALNAHFIAIKVDREERPDVDEVYMTAVTLQFGHGGWPLSVFLTPDLDPFFGGTYFPRDAGPQRGQVGFLDLVRRVAELWERPDMRPDLVRQAAQMAEAIRSSYRSAAPGEIDAALLDAALDAARSSYDAAHGGFGMSAAMQPKFPSPSTIEMVLRGARRTGDGAVRAMALATLDAMARGGIHDHVGGGFHRYSVTRDWLVPHFEKMLYDNAQLLGLYAQALLETREPRYERAARDIARWVLREMTDADGGFYSAQDADDPGGPEGEGGFYTWTPDEVLEALDAEPAGLFLRAYDVTGQGNWPEKPGRSLLRRVRTDEELAADAGLDAARVREVLDAARARLYEAREERPKPMTDTKVLAGWNGLMISGLCKAHQVFLDDAYRDAAVRAGRFLRERLVVDGRLMRRWAGGRAGHDAVLSDHAYVVAAFLDLYESTFDRSWLAEALRLADATVERFGDGDEGGFFFSPADGERLIARGKSGFDQARPSGNAAMAACLLRIAALQGDEAAAARARRTLELFAGQMRRFPLGFAGLLNALDFATDGGREIFVAGEAGDPATMALIRAVWQDPDPNRVLALVEPGAGLAELLPPAAGKEPVDGRPAAYVCRDHACHAPVTDPAAVRTSPAKGE